MYFFIFIVLDIHTAAKEIAEVNEVNLEKIWDMLLEKWLCPSTVPSEVSEQASKPALTARVPAEIGAECVLHKTTLQRRTD